MGYWRGTHTPCGGTMSFNKDVSEDEAYCENCGWVDIWEARHEVETRD
jgi:hypothetical protein